MSFIHRFRRLGRFLIMLPGFLLWGCQQVGLAVELAEVAATPTALSTSVPTDQPTSQPPIQPTNEPTATATAVPGSCTAHTILFVGRSNPLQAVDQTLADHLIAQGHTVVVQDTHCQVYKEWPLF